jgi:hypothetical protein
MRGVHHRENVRGNRVTNHILGGKIVLSVERECIVRGEFV